MPTQQEKIIKKETNTEKVKEIIKNSGHNFHYKVVNLLREKGWFVLVSPFYRDNVTDKSREIDIIAEKAYDVRMFEKWLGNLNVKLFIECKHINKECVFWFDNKDTERAIERIREDTGLPHPYQDSTLERHHYYTPEKVAKLFSSGMNKQLENEPIYKAINQCLHGMIYYRYRGSILPRESSRSQKILKTITYPMIVVNNFDNFYRVDSSSEKFRKIEDNFLIEVNYAYLVEGRKSKDEYFLIDVVEFDKLIKFLEEDSEGNTIKRDIDKIREYLVFKAGLKNST